MKRKKPGAVDSLPGSLSERSILTPSPISWALTLGLKIKLLLSYTDED